jgi:hypothetical protein
MPGTLGTGRGAVGLCARPTVRNALFHGVLLALAWSRNFRGQRQRKAGLITGLINSRSGRADARHRAPC